MWVAGFGEKEFSHVHAQAPLTCGKLANDYSNSMSQSKMNGPCCLVPVGTQRFRNRKIFRMSDKPHLAQGAIGQFGGRVGHKAAGFISKKFFHPSNYKNQEKLWAAIEAKKEEEQRQEELRKKREEERRIEGLMSEMKSAASSSSLHSKKRDSSSIQEVPTSQSRQEKEAVEETRKRLAMIRREGEAGVPLSPSKPIKLAIRSSFAEDIHEHGHTEVWGSFFDMKEKKWGYACCRSLDGASKCEQ